MGSMFGDPKAFPSAVLGGGGYPTPGPSLAQQIAALFAQGQAGAWYDPTDLSTLFQDSTGTTPVTATGQPVGLMIDKRLGYTVGAQLVVNGDFAQQNVNGWVGAGPGPGVVAWSAGGLQLTAAAAFDQARYALSGLTIGQSYEVSATIGASASNTYLDIVSASPAAATALANTARSVRLVFIAGATTCTIAFVSTAIQVATIDNVSARELPGNHARQTTAGFRPVYRNVAGRQYLEFDGVDDRIVATFAIAQPIDRISAFANVSFTASDRVMTCGSGVIASLLQDVPTNLFIRDSVGFIGPVAAVAGVQSVVTERYSGATSRIALNSGAYVTGDAGSNAGTAFVIGAETSGGAGTSVINLAQVIMRGGPTALTESEIAACRAICALAGGVAL